MAVTYSRYKLVTNSLPKRLRNGRFASETATWIQLELLGSSVCNSFSQTTGRHKITYPDGDAEDLDWTKLSDLLAGVG